MASATGLAHEKPPLHKTCSKKKLHHLTTEHWRDLAEGTRALDYIEQITSSEYKADDFCQQLQNALAPRGALVADAGLRCDVLQFVQQHVTDIFSLVTDSRLRAVYESLLHNLTNSKDDKATAARLQETAFIAVTEILCKLDAPKRDLRLLKAHVGLMYRMLDPRGLETASATVKRVYQPETLAAECLCSLEKAFPALLAADAGAILHLSKLTSSTRAGEGVVVNAALVQLAALVVGNSSQLYIEQQQTTTSTTSDNLSGSQSASGATTPEALENDDADSDEGVVAENSESELLLLQAAQKLSGTQQRRHSSSTSTNSRRGQSPPLAVRLMKKKNLGTFESHITDGGGGALEASTSTCDTLQGPQIFSDDVLNNNSTEEEEDGDDDVYNNNASNNGKQHKSPTSSSSNNLNNKDVETNTPKGVLSVGHFSSAQTSRKSLLDGHNTDGSTSGDTPTTTTATEKQKASSSRTTRFSPAASALRRSSLTTALTETALNAAAAAAAASASTVVVVTKTNSNAATELDLMTPRTSGSLSVFGSSHLPIIRPATTTAPLRRLVPPMHLHTGDIADAPKLILTPDAQRELETTLKNLLIVIRRLPPSTITEIGRLLAPMLHVVSTPSASTEYWPLFERMLSARSSPLLKTVLGLYDAVPEVFQGRGPALMEKVLVQVNDSMLSSDYRVAAASWVLRSHAAAVHDVDGDIDSNSQRQLLLTDSWERLLLRVDDPPPLAAIKVKTLVSCLDVGVGDPAAVCGSVCRWEGFGGIDNATPTDQQLRAVTYTLRQLRSVECSDKGATQRMHASLAAGIVQLLAERPTLCPAIEELLKQQHSDGGSNSGGDRFVHGVLSAFDAMFAAVDGQFEPLLAKPEDEQGFPIDGATAAMSTRVKAALVSHSASITGLLRGMSFQLSFTKRHHSVALQGSGASMRSASMVAAAVRQQRQSSSSSANRGRMAFNGGNNNSTSRGGGGDGGGSGVVGRGVSAAVPFAAKRVNVSALRSSVVGAFNPHQTPFTADINNHTQDALAPSLLSPPTTTSALLPPPRVAAVSEAPTPPIDIDNWRAALTWLSDKTTWEDCAVTFLTQDLMRYRGLMQLVLSDKEVKPVGTLQVLANYCWQYKNSHPSHILSSRQAGNAILALSHTAILTHLLPSSSSSTTSTSHSSSVWSECQKTIADSVHSVLDALEEGFPVIDVRQRAQKLGLMLQNSEAWKEEAKAVSLESMLRDCVAAAVQG